MMLVAKLFTVNKEFIDAVPLVSLRWTRQTNKEYTFNVKFALSPPENTYYIKIIDQDSSLKFIPSGYLSKSSSLTEYTLNSWETTLDSEGWIPDDWQWWDNKLLSVVIADHCYGFRKIGFASTDQLSTFVDYEHVVVAAIDSGNGSVYLDTHGYFLEESETEIAYYESGFAIYRIQIPEEARRPGMVLRWSDSVGGTTDISVQFRWSNLPYDYEGSFTEEVSPARSDNVNPNETKGIDVPESSLTYLFIKFNLKYDAGTNGVNYENEITTESGIVYYGKTPLLSAFELIYRVATSVSPGIIDVPVKTLTADVHGKSSLLESLKAISEAYDLVFMCDIDSSGVVTLNCYSEYGDNIRSTAGILSDIKNINVSDKSETLEIIEGVHCFGAGDGIDRLYAFVKMDGIDTPKKVATFEDGDITNIADLQEAGAQYLEDENSISSKVTFEYFGEPRITLHDYVSIIHNGTPYENKISEESISCGANGVEERKYTIGFKAYPFRKLYGYTFSGSYLKTPIAPSSLSAREVDGTWYLSWVGNGDSYLIEHKRSDATVWNRSTVSSNSSIITNVSPGIQYLFRVYSVVGNTVSDASTTVSTSGVSENQLTPEKKTLARADWDAIASELSTYDALATEYGLTSEKTAYDTAFQNLANYLNNGTTWVSGVPLWISDDELGNTTVIVYATWLSMWAAYSNALLSLQSAVRSVSSVLLSITSRSAVRNRAGIIAPESITATASKSDGTLYSGRFVISGTANGITYTDLYTSESDEPSKTFVIPIKVTIESVEYYTLAIRIRLYKSGGTDVKLSEDSCIISLNQDTTPVYWGSRTSAPESAMLENDYYFDSNVVASGGGVFRYYNGSLWVAATSEWPFYNEAWSSKITDAMVWASQYNETIAAVNAVFESIVASSAFISKLATQTQFSAQMCDDGITPRMEINWDSAIAKFRSQDGSEETVITENKIISYSGQGIFRRAVSIKSDSVSWLDAPTAGAEVEVGRIRRLGVGSDKILLDGYFNANVIDPTWGGESVINSASSGISDIIQLHNGQIRIAYTTPTNILVERIKSGDSWGDESIINNSSSRVPAYIESDSGVLRISYTRDSDNLVVERIWNGSAWGDESVISSVASTNGDYVNFESVIRIIYTRDSDHFLIERVLDGSSWLPENIVNGYSSFSPCFGIIDSILRVAYSRNTDSFLVERIWNGSAWGDESVISDSDSYYPNYMQLTDGTSKIMYTRGSDYNIVERSLGGVIWGDESVISAVPSEGSKAIQLSDGAIILVYTRNAGNFLVQRIIDRYQSLSYPQSGYVSGRGYWTKFADGTLIQRGDKQSSSSSSSATRSYSVTFPIPFIDTNYHVSHCEKTSINGYSFSPDFCRSSASTTATTLHTIEVNTNTTTGYGNISWTAIGRWKV